MARLLLIDVIDNDIREVNIDESDLDTFHELLHCRCFDVERRSIGKKYFDIFCDDEGLLKNPQPPVSAYNVVSREPMLVGNLIIANHDNEGNITDLSDEDIEHIKENIMFATSPAKPKGYKLLNCEY